MSRQRRIFCLLGIELPECISDARNRVNTLVALGLKLANIENALAIKIAWAVFLAASFKKVLVLWVF
jgi:hypothetical protein